jgi:post-segregation antitoxin (ccd killing protein)
VKVTVSISEEIAARAKARGLPVEAYIEELLAQQVEPQAPGNGRPRTRAEIRAWLDSLAQFSDKIPPLPENISREWIYQEHD